MFIFKIGMIFLLRKIPTRRRYEKSFWLAVVITLGCVWPGGGHAQGIQAGDQFVSVFAGAGGATNNTSLHLDLRDDEGASLAKSQDLGWGDESVSFGVQYLYAVNSYWAFGAEYQAQFFDGATDELHGFGFSGQQFKSTVDKIWMCTT